MFKFSEELQRWVPFNFTGTIIETRTIYGDSLEEFPPGSEIEQVELTDDQVARLDAIGGDRAIYLEDLIAFVMLDLDTPGSEKYRETMALEKVIDSLPEDLVGEHLEDVIRLAKVWKKDTRYRVGERLSHKGKLYQVRQDHTSQEHQPPDAEGMLAIYLPYTPPGQIIDYDPDRNLAANPYQVGEIIRFPYGVYEAVRITNFSPQEYAPDWIKRDDLA